MSLEELIQKDNKQLNNFFGLNKFGSLLILGSLLLVGCCDDIPDIKDSGDNLCFVFNNENHQGNDFYLFDPGDQENGSASGIKINETWEASVSTSIHENSIKILLFTYWQDEMDNPKLLAERIDIAEIPLSELFSNNCLNLKNENNLISSDSIVVKYRLNHGDQPLLQKYKLDLNADNKIEISEYDSTTGLYEIFFKASFISDNPGEPEFPALVRFYDVIIRNE